MKIIYNKAVTLIATALTCLVLFTACEDKKQTETHSEHNTMENHTEHQSKGHDHHAHTGAEKKYGMIFRSEPSVVEAGEPAKLYFRPEEAGKSGSLVPLDLVHEMKVHLFIMSKDLSYFAHEHPEDVADSSFMWEHTFPSGGEYILFQDYTPTGSTHQLGRQIIQVSGEEIPAKALGEENLTWEHNGYKATLKYDQDIQANKAVELKASISKDEKPVSDLDDYLGALAHVVIVSEDGSEFVHVHPMESETHGPDILLHTNFPEKGKYKVFMQFQHKGTVQTSTFVVTAG